MRSSIGAFALALAISAPASGEATPGCPLDPAEALSTAALLADAGQHSEAVTLFSCAADRIQSEAAGTAIPISAAPVVLAWADQSSCTTKREPDLVEFRAAVARRVALLEISGSFTLRVGSLLDPAQQSVKLVSPPAPGADQVVSAVGAATRLAAGGSCDRLEVMVAFPIVVAE